MKEDEDVFELENPDDIVGNVDFHGKEYNIMDEDAISDDEFNRMLEELMGDAPSVLGEEELPEDVKAQVSDESEQPAEENDSFGAEFSDLMPEAAGTGTVQDEHIENASAAEGNTEAESDGMMNDDILDLINSIHNSDFMSDEGQPAQENMPVDENIRYGTEAELEQSSALEDIGDVFADTLSVVNSLSDEEPLPDLVPDGEEKAEDKKKNKKEKKKDKKAKKKSEKPEKERKPGFFKRVFGNVKAERSEEEIAQIKEKIIADAQEKEAAEEAKKQKAAAAKAEKKKKAAEAKAAAVKKKQENAKKKAEAAKLKKDAKEKKKQELQNLLDAVDEDEGRINRVGAAVVFVFFAVIAVVILIGTKRYSYSANLENAQKNFGNKHYSEAYEDISGLEIKEEDETFYLQVVTVMYTYKQLRSFDSYYTAGLYPQALDSLLKGLQRYDKYSSIARVLDVDGDLNEIRSEIVNNLEKVYGLSEQEAVLIAAIDNQEEYTAKVYEIADKLAQKK